MTLSYSGALHAAEATPRLPRDAQGPVFAEPWQAQAFAMVAALCEKGVFSAAEWSAALGAEILRAQAAGDPDTGATYYHHWLAALERMVSDKGLTTPSGLKRCRDAWQAAARHTPHGKPIELPRDFKP